MTEATHGLVFARVTSKCHKPRKGWSYSLSNGTRFTLKNDPLELGQWYFFHLKETGLKTYSYVSHHLLTKKEGEDFALRQKNLIQYAEDAVQAWTMATEYQKQVITKSLGFALTGLGAASFGAEALGAVIAEGLGGVVTGGGSLVISGCLGVLSYYSYKDTVKAVAGQKACIQSYRDSKEMYTRWLNRMCPDEYMNLKILDPELQDIILQLKKMIVDFDWDNLWKTEESVNFNFATA